MDQEAHERWSVVDAVAQLTVQDVVISFQRAVGAARLRTLWMVPCMSMDPAGTDADRCANPELMPEAGA